MTPEEEKKGEEGEIGSPKTEKKEYMAALGQLLLCVVAGLVITCVLFAFFGSNFIVLGLIMGNFNRKLHESETVSQRSRSQYWEWRRKNSATTCAFAE